MSPSSEPATRTSEFLAHILPAEGWRVVAIKTPGGVRHVFCATNDEAAHAIRRATAAGLDAYHACATFQNAASRKGDNALAARAFWLDVDVGPGKPYADLGGAGAAVVDFVRSSGLPAPCVVTSGRGLHLYWPLVEALAPEPWVAAARRLRALVEFSPLKVDQSRTADIASILRPAGALNFKYDPPLPVEVGHLRGPYPIDDILGKLGPIFTPEIIAHGHRMAVTARVNVTNEEPSHAVTIVDRCAQLAALRDSGGKLPEPEWYAALCLLAHCEDGVDLAHRWSAGDERYSPEGTDAKLAHALKDSGPTTCKGFESRNAARCAGCPHYGLITSPIQLGRAVKGTEQVESAAIVSPLPEPLMPAPPWPFQRDSAGRLLLPEKAEDGTIKTRVIYEHPLYVRGVRKGETSDDTSLVVAHKLPHDGWAEVVLPWRDHSPQVILNLLGNKRIWLTPDNRKSFMDYIYRAGKEFLGTKATDMEYDQMGWKDDFGGFLLGRDYFKVATGEIVPLGVSPEIEARAAMLRPVGSYEAWKRAANQLFAGPQQSLMLLASFAAPLMRLRMSEGGAILSGISQESGKGKSVALAAAKSVWGGKWALDMNRTDTVNSRFRSLALMANLPIIFDELRNRDPEVVKDFILSFSDGRDKNRLTIDGKMRGLIGGWSTLLLSCSNLSLAQTVSFDGEAAQMARILEYQMELPAGLSVSDGNNLKATLESNYGHAGRDFLTGLCSPENIAWAKTELEAKARHYEKLLPGTENRLYIATLAAIHTAATLVQGWGILEFSVNRVMDFALQAAREMKALLMETMHGPVQLLGRFINDNWEGCIAVDSDEAGEKTVMLHTPRLPPVMRYTRNTGLLLIDQRAIRHWCTQNKTISGLLRRDLLAAGVMHKTSTEPRRSLGRNTLFAAAGQVIVWMIDTKSEVLTGVVAPRLENVTPMRVIPTREQIRDATPR